MFNLNMFNIAAISFSFNSLQDIFAIVCSLRWNKMSFLFFFLLPIFLLILQYCILILRVAHDEDKVWKVSKTPGDEKYQTWSTTPWIMIFWWSFWYWLMIIYDCDNSDWYDNGEETWRTQEKVWLWYAGVKYQSWQWWLNDNLWLWTFWLVW